MAVLRYLVALVFLLTACVPEQAPVAAPTDTSVVAFVGVTVIPMDREQILENRTVIVRDGLIQKVGPTATVAIPPEAERIEGEGKYLLPGLVDFHIHLRSTDELVSYLAYGVTTVVHMSGAQSGAPDLLRYRAQLAAGTLPGPTLYITGPMLDGDPPIWPGVSVAVSSPEEARRIVTKQKNAGYDFIKVYNNLPPDALTAAVTTAHKLGMAVLGHIPRKPNREQALQRALASGVDMIAHGEEYFFTFFHHDVDSLLDQGLIPYPDETRIPLAVQMTKEAGVAVTPNLSFVAMTRRQLDDMDAMLSDPETRYLHPNVLAMWKSQNPTRRPDRERFDRREQAKYLFLKKLVKALHDADILLLLGTDAAISGLFPGKSAHLELQELVDAGMTPYAALVAGTRNPGQFITTHVASADSFGVIAPGQRADIMLLNENPLTDIAHIAEIDGVMTRGRWYSKDALDQMREKIATSYHR